MDATATMSRRRIIPAPAARARAASPAPPALQPPALAAPPAGRQQEGDPSPAAPGARACCWLQSHAYGVLALILPESSVGLAAGNVPALRSSSSIHPNRAERARRRAAHEPRVYAFYVEPAQHNRYRKSIQVTPHTPPRAPCSPATEAQMHDHTMQQKRRRKTFGAPVTAGKHP